MKAGQIVITVAITVAITLSILALGSRNSSNSRANDILNQQIIEENSERTNPTKFIDGRASMQRRIFRNIFSGTLYNRAKKTSYYDVKIKIEYSNGATEIVTIQENIQPNNTIQFSQDLPRHDGEFTFTIMSAQY